MVVVGGWLVVAFEGCELRAGLAVWRVWALGALTGSLRFTVVPEPKLFFMNQARADTFLLLSNPRPFCLLVV
jgi:hypothetical protein